MESRTRYSTRPSTENVVFRPVAGIGNYNPLKVLTYPFVPGDFRELQEVYTPNSHRTRRNQWKNFQHYKCGASLASFGTKHPTTALTEHGGYAGSWYHLGEHQDVAFGYRGFGPVDCPNTGLTPYYFPEPGKPDSFVQAPTDLAELLNAGNAAIIADVKSDISLLNSIVELKDFRSTLGGLKQFVLHWKSSNRAGLLKQLRNMAPKNLTFAELARWAAQKHLAVSFAWLPLVSDISAMWSSVRDMQHELTRLLRLVERPQLRHYTRQLFEEEPSDETYGPYPLGPLPYQGSVHPGVSGVHKSYRTVTPSAALFNITMEYSLELTPLQVAHAQLFAYLDVVGINLNPAIIWNAIPFTFLIDWVLNVSSVLESIKVGNMEPRIHIRNYCWSIRRERNLRVSCEIGKNTFGYEYTPVRPIVNVRETAYRRDCGFPSVTSLVAGGLTLKEISLGASLLINWRRWRPRK